MQEGDSGKTKGNHRMGLLAGMKSGEEFVSCVLMKLIEVLAGHLVGRWLCGHTWVVSGADLWTTPLSAGSEGPCL